MRVDILLLVGIQILLLTIGASWTSHLLIKGYKPPGWKDVSNPSHGSHWLFAATTSSSCMLFLLVLSEIVGLFSKIARWQCWLFNLYVLLLLLIVVIPWYQVYVFLRHARGWRPRSAIYVTTATWLVYLYLFIQVTQSSNDDSNASWTERGLFRISTIGCTLISVLCGCGVVNAPYTTWVRWTRSVSEHEYALAIRAYQQTQSLIEDKKRVLARLELQQNEQGDRRSGSESLGFFERLSQPFGRSAELRELDVLRAEVQQLEGLALTMKPDIAELERGKAHSQFSQTAQGRCWNCASILFTIHCIYRWLTTAINVVFQRVNSADPITNMLSLLMSHLGTDRAQIDTAFWSQQLSFWLAGVIVFGSVRGFLKILTKLLRSFSKRMVLSNSNVLLFIAHMMGMYFISSVLMMQVSLPPEYRYLMTATLTNVEFDYYRRWSDVIILIASIVTALILYVIHETSDARNLASDYADAQLLSAEAGHVPIELDRMR